MDEATARWRQSGRVYLWRYVDDPKNYRGHHLTADAAGCESLLQLFALLRDAKFTAAQTIELSVFDDDHQPATGYSGRFRTSRRWKIVHSKPKHAADHWRLTATETELTLELGLDRLDELRRGVEAIRNDGGDYCIGDDGAELWFWPHR